MLLSFIFSISLKKKKKGFPLKELSADDWVCIFVLFVV